MNFKIAAHTDIGIKKSTNQDSVLVKAAQTDYGKVMLAVVCDGMGGLAKGELASATVIRMLSKWFEENFPQMLYQGISLEKLKEVMGNLIYDANDKISKYGNSLRVSMGTTLVMILVVGNVYYIVNVGDSRVYFLKEQTSQITHDQTFIQREMDMGRMTWDEARRDPRRNVLLQCIGASEIIVPDYYTGTLDSGTMILLCSDGFRHVISQDELYEHLNPYRLFNEQTMQEGLVYLTELNKNRNEVDNISSVLIRAD